MFRHLLLIVVITCLGGCSASRLGPYSPLKESSRNTAKAEQLNRDAIRIMESNPEIAEQFLREALTADVWHGPSHNSLGVLALNRGDLYQAANEFEWARKLLPGHPDPRMNLALTLEKAGRYDEALAEYNSALDVYPNHLPSTQALARLLVRLGMEDERTSEFLNQIALRGDTHWRSWAMLQLQR